MGTPLLTPLPTRPLTPLPTRPLPQLPRPLGLLLLPFNPIHSLRRLSTPLPSLSLRDPPLLLPLTPLPVPSMVLLALPTSLPLPSLRSRLPSRPSQPLLVEISRSPLLVPLTSEVTFTV